MTQSEVAPNVIPLNGLTHIELDPNGDPSNLRSPMIQQAIMRNFNRIWAAHLETHEYRLLGFILDNTVNRGWSRRLFSYRLMENGDNITCGTRLSKRQLIRTIAGLEAKQAITVDRADTTKGLWIAANAEWNPRDTIIPVPKRRKEGRKNAALSSDNHRFCAEGSDTCDTSPATLMSPPECHRRHHIKEETLEEKIGEKDYSDPVGSKGPVSLISVPVRVRQRPTSGLALPAKKEIPPTGAIPPYEPSLPLSLPIARREFSPAEPSADRRPNLEVVLPFLKPSAIEKTYRAAFEEAYSDQPGVMPTKWTVEQLGMINNVVLKRWLGTPEECHEYVEWLVVNFYRLRRTAFSWMKKPCAPVAPDAKFIARWHTNLLSAYHERKQESWIESIDSHELRNFKRMTTVEGRTEEEARMKLAEDRVTLALREEMIKRERQAATMFRTGQIAIEQANKMPRGIHPRSETARRIRELEARVALATFNPNEPIDLMAAVEAGEKIANEATAVKGSSQWNGP